MYSKIDNIEVAPSILSGDFGDIGQEIKKIEASGAGIIHLDVMDGVFVPNITFGPKMIKDIRKRTGLFLDVHLMIVDPDKYIDAFASAGADLITFHVEAAPDPEKVLRQIGKNKIKTGLAISPDTDINKIKQFLGLCDLVLLMSVYPGFSGQSFIEKSMKKLEMLHEMKLSGGHNFRIEIDGGISSDNAAEVIKRGAEILVMGNGFFMAKDPAEVVRAVKNIRRI